SKRRSPRRTSMTGSETMRRAPDRAESIPAHRRTAPPTEREPPCRRTGATDSEQRAVQYGAQCGSLLLLNSRHHSGGARRGPAWLDPCSSAARFSGWSRPCVLPPGYTEDEPTATLGPRCWLLRTGWRKAGETISPDHVPGAL